MPADLPGFYYDEEKRKYFRIQKNHVLPSSSNVHTQQSVKAAREKQHHDQRKIERSRRIKTEKVKRPSLLIDSPAFRLTRCRMGQARQKTFGHEAARIFAAGLTSRNALFIFADEENASAQSRTWLFHETFQIEPNGQLAIPATRSHEYDGETFHVRYPGLLLSPPASSWHPGPYSYLGSEVNLDPSVFVEDDLAISSEMAVHMEHAGRLYTISLCPVRNIVVRSRAKNQTLVREYEPIQPENERVHIWDLACSVTGGTWAAATEEGLILSKVEAASGGYRPVRKVKKLRGKAQVTVDYKEEDVVMSGERSGRVNFSDHRTGDTVVRLLHSSAVVGTKSTKHHSQILVLGFSTLSLYDLRFLKDPASRTHRATRVDKRSKPYLEFAVPKERHISQYSQGNKLAYSPELDIVAAASSTVSSSWPYRNSRHHVTLYSAQTGKVLPSPLTTHKFEHEVTCIDLKRVRDGPESIFTLSDPNFLEWTLHNDIAFDGGNNDNEGNEGNDEQETNNEKKMKEYLKARPLKSRAEYLAFQDNLPKTVAQLWEDGNRGPLAV